MKENKWYIKGKWYKDNEGDFIKFEKFSNDDTFLTSAHIFVSRHGEYSDGQHYLIASKYSHVPMTIEEMKKYLPEEEWWVASSNDLFPIF